MKNSNDTNFSGHNFFVFGIIFVVISFFAIFSTFVAEKTDVMGFREENLKITFTEQGEDLLMSWTPLPYPCVYTIDTLNETTGLAVNTPKYHKLTSGETTQAEYIVPRAPIPTFYSISARGIFGEIFRTKTVTANPNFPEPPHPVPIYHYTKDNPASLMPFLIWHTVPNAVCYEVELLDAPPEIEGGIYHSQAHHLESTTRVYTNGYQADLTPYKKNLEVYWRARAVGLHMEPIGEFCKAERIYFDDRLPTPNCPLVNNFDLITFAKQPIYPVYSWIPLHDAYKYEVELLDHPPKVENDVEPSPDSLWRQTTTDQSSCYDEYARPYAGAYYWRVRALDKEDKPIGTWSNSEKFIVDDYSNGVDVAIFGDSISHGGGAVSYSPRSLEYTYATYIDLPVLNLSRSGDTSHTALERFEKDVLPFKPRNLIISTGANGLRADYIPVETIIDDLTEINRLCIENNIRPIFLTIMPINPENITAAFHTDTDPEWHDKLRKVNVFIKKQPYFIDIEQYFYDEDGNMSNDFSIDGIHPDLAGKMLIGEIINQNLNLFDLEKK